MYQITHQSTANLNKNKCSLVRGGKFCYNNLMNKIVNVLKKYMYVVSIFIVVSIILGVSYSNFIVTSNNHKAAEMYIGELKYSIEIDGESVNNISVPSGETIVDVKVNNQNPVDTYYKLLYLKNSNLTVEYYETTKDTNDVTTTYSKPNDSITNSNSNTIKLKITNSSTSSQNIGLSVKGGYITNNIQDIITPSTYSEITLVETPSTNTYFCTTTDALTQGLQYVNGQYTYAYKQEGNYASSGLAWKNISNNGWGVQLTDKTSTDTVTSKLCTYINNKSVVSMSYMFHDSQATTLDVSNFDTSKVTDMSYMFSESQATALDLSNFNTTNITNMSAMFSGSQATTINVSSFDTSKVTDMNYMFHRSQATTLDLSNFDTSNVTNMGAMFYMNEAITLDLSNFNTSKVIDMIWMFSFSHATTINVSSFDTSKVVDMGYMFYYTKSVTLDVSKFNTSNVRNMSYMFAESKVTTLDLNNFDTTKVTDMSYMFAGIPTTTLDISSFDTSNVRNMDFMFANRNIKTIYVSNKFNTKNVTISTKMFNNSINLVGGSGTTYNSSYIDKTYARIDKSGTPGYFTDITDKDIPAPNSFATDSWKTIVKAVQENNISKYNVGDTKTVDLGTYGTHTLRIANTSTPSECSRAGFSQTACGFVLEFADIITSHPMNDSDTNVGGWPATSMRTFVNNDIYNAIPSEIKNAIIDTTVVSGHGNTSGETNFTSTDKLYLLSTAEVWAQGSSNTIDYDTARDVTRQLDYYKNLGTSTSNYSGAIKKNGTSAYYWWLRAVSSNSANIFFIVFNNGDWNSSYASNTNGVAPAFRIG